MVLQLHTLTTGPLQENCYILDNEQELLLIDPGAESQKILDFLKATKKTLQGILLTHAHFDHIGALPAILKHYSVPVFLAAEEATWLTDPYFNLSQFFGQPFSYAIKTKDFQPYEQLGCFSFQVLKTPGHSIGGRSFYFPKEVFVLAGDTLFFTSIGRTDFPTGDFSTLKKSIQEQLFSLPDETVVYPGHGKATTVGFEKSENPFVGVKSHD